jgi:hypothetical protein
LLIDPPPFGTLEVVVVRFLHRSPSVEVDASINGESGRCSYYHIDCSLLLVGFLLPISRERTNIIHVSPTSINAREPQLCWTKIAAMTPNARRHPRHDPTLRSRNRSPRDVTVPRKKESRDENYFKQIIIYDPKIKTSWEPMIHDKETRAIGQWVLS